MLHIYAYMELQLLEPNLRSQCTSDEKRTTACTLLPPHIYMLSSVTCAALSLNLLITIRSAQHSEVQL
jgi:hypothetical protein